MSAFDALRAALRRVPRGFPADGRSLGLGLAAAMGAQRARGAEPVERRARTPRSPHPGGAPSAPLGDADPTPRGARR